MFQVAIEKRNGRLAAEERRQWRIAAARKARGDLPTAGAGRFRRLPGWFRPASSMWNRSGSGLVVRSTLNSETTVWKPCASITVHCLSAKVGSRTPARSPPYRRSVALSSISIVAALFVDRHALDRGVLGEVDVVLEQELQRRLGDEIEVLGVELLVAHRDAAAVGDDFEPRRRVVSGTACAQAARRRAAPRCAGRRGRSGRSRRSSPAPRRDRRWRAPPLRRRARARRWSSPIWPQPGNAGRPAPAGRRLRRARPGAEGRARATVSVSPPKSNPFDLSIAAPNRRSPPGIMGKIPRRRKRGLSTSTAIFLWRAHGL